MPATSLYVHIPFCNHRCGYCDFNTYAGLQRLIPSYGKAISLEIEYLTQTTGEQLPVHTIYFGGGTPSLLPAKELEAILVAIKLSFELLPDPEITLEANPGTVSIEYLETIRSLGINRLSLGMQSANQNELVLLERQHSYEDVKKAVEWSRVAGINNLNLDLIFGLPDQPIDAWILSLEAALSLNPEHLSLYALTLEHGTPMQHKVESGVLSDPDPDRAADMYEVASERLAAAGYIQYEISNWSRKVNPDEVYECKHNLQYWRNMPYLGVGAGAHGFIDNYRTVNIRTPGAYNRRMNEINRIQKKLPSFPRTPATVQMGFIDQDTEIGETMMMGLRLISEGVSDYEFTHRFGVRLRDRYGDQITRLISLGLLEWSDQCDERLRLTQKGRLLGNQVFKEFI